MRLRRKKNLEERILACSAVLAVREGYDFYDKPQIDRDFVDFFEIFGNLNPVHLEIGCGKGGFVQQIAKKYPNTNFVAVEKLSNVIVEACEKVQNEGNFSNIRFANCSAENLLLFFKPHSFEKIYLNFSCPFPKKTYANRRLTCQKMLKIYDTLLTEGGSIFQKTDNKEFFEYSVEQFCEYGFELKDKTNDLHHSSLAKENIMTEYEKKFVADNLPIFAVTALKR